MAGVASLRAVVDRDDLERLGERRQGRQRLVDQALEVGLLVVGREEVRQPGDAGRMRDARSPGMASVVMGPRGAPARASAIRPPAR